MSRQWKPTEAMLEHEGQDGQPAIFQCKNSDIRVAQLTVALDGITVFVKRGSKGT